jgi:tetratricopeptide (TPR) repeat protein
VLLCFEADRMLGYRIVQAKEGENRLKWSVADNQFPNMTLTATRMREQKQDLARLDVRVERGLSVAIKPNAGNVKPGDPVEVEITTTDQNGKPASAELSLSLVDKALVRLFGQNGPNIQQFFYDQSRLGAFGSTSTNLFSYKPATIRVPESIIEEAERLQAQVANNASRDQARGRAQSYAARGAMAMQAPAAMAPPGAPIMADAAAPARVAPASAAPSMPAGSGGGMGGMMGGSGGRRGEPANRLREAADKEEAGLELNLARKSKPGDSFDRRLGGEITGKQMAMAEEKIAFGQAEMAQPDPARERTIETAYWNAAIITDDAGHARLTIKAPNSLGEYEFDGRGVTAADTLVGQSTAELAVRKPFFVELDLPDHLTEGDRFKPSARLHHTGVKGEVALTLERYINGQSSRDVKTVNVEVDGVTNISFDEILIPATQEVRFVASAKSGMITDQESVSVPATTQGTPVLASAHGTSRDDQTVLIKLPDGRKYESLGMMVSLSPTLQRQVLEAALGAEIWPMPRDRWSCIIPPPWNTTADRAADLMAASAAIGYLRQVGGASAVDQSRLASRLRGLVSELVSRQNDDGGWPLTAIGPVKMANPQGPLPSDPSTSARVLLALAMAKETGLADSADVINRAAAYVQGNQGAARPWNTVALAYVGRVGFEELNALSRNRNQLDSAELATIALAWMKLDRRTQADELIATLLTRSRTQPPQPGKPLQRFWPAGVVGPELTTAWAAWALAIVRPGADELPQAIDWLNARRYGPGWLPFETKGPAVAAMSAWYGRAEAVEDRYRMTIRVNDQILEQFSVDGTSGSPVRLWNIPAGMIRPGENRVRFDVEGRARYGYGVELSGFSRDYGPDQKTDGKRLFIAERKMLAADPELDGRKLPTGYSVAVNPTITDNLVTMLPEGQRAIVRLHLVGRQENFIANRGDIAILEEPLPSGARLVEGSLNSSSGRLQRVEQERGLLRLYFDPNQLYNDVITYEIVGVSTGKFVRKPARVYSLMDHAQVHASPESSLTVLPPGEKSTDPYKPTPDELFQRGLRHFEKGRLAESAKAFEELNSAFTVQDAHAGKIAQMLLDAHIAAKEPRKIVQDFEVLKEKAADLVIPIEKIRVVGDSYAAIGEFERAWLVWRAVLEAGYLDETRLGQTLRQTGRPLEAAAYLLRVWQSYPSSASLQSDFFGLSRWLAQLASDSQNNPELRRQLLDAKITRSELIAQAIGLTQLFLSLAPDDPLGDEASLALIGDLSQLDAHEAVVKVAENAAKIYPKSKFLDSFQFGEALARYNLGELDKAIAIAQRVAESTYEEPGGVRRPSPNRAQAQYIMAQIFDARSQFEKALAQYQQVQAQFPDAAVAVRAIERRSLKMPEVTVVPTKPDTKSITAKFKVDYRNIDTLDLKVYPVDLMRLYLTKRNLDQIASVDLAGIKPLAESTVKLGEGKDYADKSHEVSLSIPGEGAYLVMVRGRELFASGIVLATPIELEVLEEPTAGRLRISAREAGTGKPLSRLQVKYSGSVDNNFRDGQTDLRGVFVADGLAGMATIVVRQSAGRFAFYRGKSALGGVLVENFQPALPTTPSQDPGRPPMEGQQLDQNLRGQNRANEMKQIERLENRYNFENRSKGVQIQSVK